MTTALSQYLNSIRDNLRLDPPSEREVINELETHIEDELEELKEAGLSEEEAANTCVRLLGSAKLVARQIYEAHSQGTWRQALLASMPHLLFGLLFALNWWRGISWLLAMLVLTLGTAVYGWWRGKPTWLFPWLGYSLLPVVIAGLLLLYLPKGWAWLAIILYIPLAAWLVYAITVQTIKKDWLYSSLMLFPIPIIIGWFIAVRLEGRFPEFSIERLHDFASWVGLSFLALGVSVAIFIRLRQRRLKVAILIISGLLTLTMVAGYAWSQFGLHTFLALILLMLSIFLVPALLERRIRHSRT
ncbi:MAG: permease prefix domain 1-containing protein [Dehalococcoidales bacterium]